MKKEEKNQLAVIPTAELLSELDSLVVFGGNGSVDPLDDNTGCTINNVANCGAKCIDACNPKVTIDCDGYSTSICVPKVILDCYTKAQYKCLDPGIKFLNPCS